MISIIYIEGTEYPVSEFTKALETQSYDNYELLACDNSSVAINRAIKKATGEYLFFGYPWMSLDEMALKRMLSAMQPKLGRQGGFGQSEISAGSEISIGDSKVRIDLVASGYALMERADQEEQEEKQRDQERTSKSQQRDQERTSKSQQRDQQVKLEEVYISPESNARVLDAEDMIVRALYPANDQGIHWNKLYRKVIIDKYKITFDEDIYYEAGRLFLMQYLLHCDGVRHLSDRHISFELGHAKTWDIRDAKCMTELTMYDRMQKALRRMPDARWLARQTLCYTELELFIQLIEKSDEIDIAKHPLRKFAKKAGKLDYLPASEDDEALYYALIQYGKTGKLPE